MLRSYPPTRSIGSANCRFAGTRSLAIRAEALKWADGGVWCSVHNPVCTLQQLHTRPLRLGAFTLASEAEWHHVCVLYTVVPYKSTMCYIWYSKIRSTPPKDRCYSRLTVVSPRLREGGYHELSYPFRKDRVLCRCLTLRDETAGAVSISARLLGPKTRRSLDQAVSPPCPMVPRANHSRHRRPKAMKYKLAQH